MAVQAANLPDGLSYQWPTSVSLLFAVVLQHVGIGGQEPAASPNSPPSSWCCDLPPHPQEADVCMSSLLHRALQQPDGLLSPSSGAANSMSC